MHSSVTNMELVENLVVDTTQYILENPGPVELEAENVSLSSLTEPESPSEASANSEKGSEQAPESVKKESGQFTY